MNKPYNKIIKENIQQVILELLKKTFKIKIQNAEIIYPELHYTTEREADFIIKINNSSQEPEILHIEFQSTNDSSMLERMYLYSALIYKSYKIPVRQILYYIGKSSMNMENRLSMNRVDFSYDLFNIQQISYQQFIHSDVPEEILWSILCDFEGQNPDLIIDQIFLDLEKKTTSLLNYQRHLRQLEMFSALRDLQSNIIKKEKDMAIEFDITKDPAYI